MSFLRNGQIYHPMYSCSAPEASLAAGLPASSSDESATGYSLAGCTPAVPASASPAILYGDVGGGGRQEKACCHLGRWVINDAVLCAEKWPVLK
jgi:hypothetical protein